MSEIQHGKASNNADFVENSQKTAYFATKDDGNDTREKLWIDCEDLIRRIQERFFSGRDETALQDQLADLLDRQAAITERECIDRWDKEALMLFTDMKVERDKLRAKLDEFDGDCYCGATVSEWYDLAVRLQADVDDLTRERDRALADAKTQRNNFDQATKAREHWKEQAESLVRTLRKDHGLDASWDGLRGFWCIVCTQDYVDARDALAAELADMERTHMRLPVDADGVPIRIGDEMEWTNKVNGEKERFTCAGYTTEYSSRTPDNITLMATNDECTEFYCDQCRHVTSDPVESLLAEFAESIEGQNEDFSRLVIAEYAERIRKAVEHGD